MGPKQIEWPAVCCSGHMELDEDHTGIIWVFIHASTLQFGGG